MRPVISRLATLFVLLLPFLQMRGADKPAYNSSRIFWDIANRKTVIQGGGYGRILQLQDGRLMAVAEGGGIKIAFSSNMGTSWTESTHIVSNPTGIGECVPDLIQLSDGTIIVAYNPRPTEPYSEDRKFGIRCKRSTDNGKTWSNEIFVYDAWHISADGCWEPSMLELPSGELQLYFADESPYTQSGEQQISMCRSFDKGLTWGEPEKVSFRAGFRDGMPVPLLLQDGRSIVVAIEDNGWGYGDFFPTTVRTTLGNNWKNYWVDATSENRKKTLDLDYCPVVCGGAPYMRQLPWGETILSYQSAYENNGTITMAVAVGDENAENFKALSWPYKCTGSRTWWNSVAVIDTGVVAAVGGMSGNIYMTRGYPMRQWNVAAGSPKIDGRSTRKEGYYTDNNSQVCMGVDLGYPCYIDFAHDEDSLYVFYRAADKTQHTESVSQPDGIRLSFETAGACTTTPLTSTYRYLFRLSGSNSRYKGSGTTWRNSSGSKSRSVITQTSSYYIIEMAIPWSDFGLSAPPTNDLRVNAELIDTVDESTEVTEIIPDAIANEPWSWMLLHLCEAPKDPCDTPVITYEKGIFHFSCTTEGAEIHHTTSAISATEGVGNESSQTTTLTATAYAIAEGYSQSETATLTIDLSQLPSGEEKLVGDVNEDGTVTMNDANMVVNIFVSN